jgi:hypothetical protein
MIYTRFGEPVTVTAYRGKHATRGSSLLLVLVRCRHEDGFERHYLAFTLRADGGWREIDAAVDAAPEVTLEGHALRKALAEAE